IYFFFSSRRRHTRSKRDWNSDVCSSDLNTDNVDFRMTYESRLKETLLKYYNTTKEPMCFGCFVNPHDQRLYDDAIWVGIDLADRSEERRVGKEYRGRGAL